jgi:hypothetical protein
MADKTRISLNAGKDERAIAAFAKLHDYCEANNVNMKNKVVELIENMGQEKVAKISSREKPSDAKIMEFVKALMEANEQATEDYDKIAITMGYLRNSGNFNFPTTKRFLETHKDMIDQHHNEIGIDEKAVKSWNTKQTKLKKAIAESETTA